MADKNSIALAKKAKQGNLEAFKALCSLEMRYIVDTAFDFLSNYQDTAEVAQRTLKKMFESIHQLKKVEEVDKWVYRIVRYNSLRRIKAREEQANDPATAAAVSNVALKDDAKIETLVARLEELYVGKQSPFASKPFVASQVFLVKKIMLIAAAILVLGIGGLGINYLVQQGVRDNVAAPTAAPIATSESYGMIVFTDAQNTDSQLNPLTAKLNKTDGEAINPHWIIVNKKNGKTVLSGEGSTVTDMNARMANKSEKVGYALKFYFEDASGNEYNYSRDFIIKK